jgi:hypothetical protein
VIWKTSTRRRPRPSWAVGLQEKKKNKLGLGLKYMLRPQCCDKIFRNQQLRNTRRFQSFKKVIYSGHDENGNESDMTTVAYRGRL